MRTADKTVETEFHPLLTSFLFSADELYRSWRSEVIITCGSEHSAYHGYTSLHYALPAQGADIRSWDKKTGRGDVPKPVHQVTALKRAAKNFCLAHNIPTDWIEVILEPDHIHIELQPKRPVSLIKPGT